ncbi:MAG: signal peptidase I [Eubacteriales bacterium]|nr:signal peptidase I [Eubacteriales bacterium]
MAAENKQKKGSGVLTVIASVILWMIILLAALFTFTTLATKDTSKVANIAGYTPLTVETDSMLPTFASGDLIFIKKVDPSTLKEGDIITFHTIINNQYALNTHRIEKIESNGAARSYVTKGDNNAMADMHIIADGDIVGKYTGKLGGFGKVISFLSSSVGFLVVIVLPMLIFFIYQLYHLIMVSISLKKAAALEAAEEAAAAVGAVGKDEADRLRAELEEAKRKAAEAEAKLAEAEKKES